MKHLFAKMTIIATVVTMTACSTNTQKENTMVGAGTGAVVGGLVGALSHNGWVIAAGAVVGALVGGAIGHNMDNVDTTHMHTALDHNRTGEPTVWTNSKTGVMYSITPTSGVMMYKGSTYCRHYVAVTKSENKTTKTKGVACRNAEGVWKQVH